VRRYRINFQPEAIAHLEKLENYLGRVASPDVGGDYVASIIEYCSGLSEFPNRGTMRDDISPGLRCISYRGRTAIIFLVEDTQVEILGVFHGGQDWESRFSR
jgi:toxin ParE1/3/4